MTFGEKLALLRKQAKWSQDDLAKKIGTSAPIVGRYERNEIKPSIEVAAKLSDVLGVTLDYLIGNASQAVSDKKLAKRIEDIETLPNDEKNIVYKMIDMALAYNKAKQAYAS
jgi:transcriptional regulator with XRE-family HTH domain